MTVLLNFGVESFSVLSSQAVTHP